jgi:hypothetical protein
MMGKGDEHVKNTSRESLRTLIFSLFKMGEPPRAVIYTSVPPDFVSGKYGFTSDRR